MLPAPARLRRSTQLRSTVRRGRRSGTSRVVLHLVLGSATDRARVGFVVSRAVGPAVVRNRVRRRLRHILAARVYRLPDGALLVVRAQRTAATASSAELAGDVDRVLARLVGSAETGASPC